MTKIFRGVGSGDSLPPQEKYTTSRKFGALFFCPKEGFKFELRKPVKRKSTTKTKVCHRPSCRTSTHSPTISNTFRPKTQTKTRKKPPRNPSHPSKKTTNSKTSLSKVSLPAPR